jgi:hypothetical protein
MLLYPSLGVYPHSELDGMSQSVNVYWGQTLVYSINGCLFEFGHKEARGDYL